MKNVRLSLKSKIIAGSLSLLTATALLFSIGLHEDIYKLIFERQLAGRSSYSEQQIYLDQNLLSSGNNQTIDLVEILSANSTSQINQEILELLASDGSQSESEEISIKLLSEKLIDLEEQENFINSAANLYYTGFEFKGKKFFQKTDANLDQVSTNSELLALPTGPWKDLSNELNSLVSTYDQLKTQGDIYTLDSNGTVEKIPASATLFEALAEDYADVALVDASYFSNISEAESLEAAARTIRSNLLKLEKVGASTVNFSLIREVDEELDSKSFFLFLGTTNQALKTNLKALIPVSLIRPTQDPQPEDCSNGFDDDLDGATDSADSDCPQVTPTATATATQIPPTDTPYPTPTAVIIQPTPTVIPNQFESDCWNNYDDDGDWAIDCSDSDCSNTPYCYSMPTPTPLNCSNASTCPESTSIYCDDCYNAGGWCNCPCQNCGTYQRPPAPPTITTPEYGAVVRGLYGNVDIAGTISESVYAVEVQIDNSNSNITYYPSTYWSVSYYGLSHGMRRVSARSIGYNGLMSEWSEIQIDIDTTSPPEPEPADFLNLADNQVLTLECNSTSAPLSFRLPNYPNLFRIQINGAEVFKQDWISAGDYTIPVEFFENQTNYIELISEFDSTQTTRAISVFVARNPNNCLPPLEAAEFINLTDGKKIKTECSADLAKVVIYAPHFFRAYVNAEEVPLSVWTGDAGEFTFLVPVTVDRNNVIEVITEDAERRASNSINIFAERPDPQSCIPPTVPPTTPPTTPPTPTATPTATPPPTVAPILGCRDSTACNYNPDATQSDASCDFTSCLGCTAPEACNYDASAKIDDGTCEFKTCEGCNDPQACNYDPKAKINNGTCDYISCIEPSPSSSPTASSCAVIVVEGINCRGTLNPLITRINVPGTSWRTANYGCTQNADSRTAELDYRINQIKSSDEASETKTAVLIVAHSLGAIATFNMSESGFTSILADPPYSVAYPWPSTVFSSNLAAIKKAREGGIAGRVQFDWTGGKASPAADHTPWDYGKGDKGVVESVKSWISSNCQNNS